MIVEHELFCDPTAVAEITKDEPNKEDHGEKCQHNFVKDEMKRDKFTIKSEKVK